jgi:hypothetical protein
MDIKRTRAMVVTAILAVAMLAVSLAPAEALSVFDEVAISAALTGRGQTPAVGTLAVGQCTGRLIVATGSLTLTCSSDVASAGRLIITLGSPSGGGAELFDLGTGPVAGGTVTLNQGQVAALLSGRLYVAVTSPGRPTGEIAARILPRIPIGMQVMRFPLLNNSLVNTGSGAIAACALAIGRDSESFEMVCVHTVQNPQQLRLILDGNTVATSNSVQSPFEVSLPQIGQQLDRFLDGDFGVVLTSAANPQGELGMVLDKCIEGPNTLCLTEERFRVTVQFTAPGQSPKLAGTVQPRSGDAGLFWFFNPSNWEVLVKVLDACSISQNFWVFLSANTNVAFTATVYDTLTGRTKTYSNPQGHIADSRADTAAFSCN